MMGFELKEDISKKDVGLFFLLLVFLAAWTFFVFYTGCILRDNIVVPICR